jgi:hypothetical protein
MGGEYDGDEVGGGEPLPCSGGGPAGPLGGKGDDSSSSHSFLGGPRPLLPWGSGPRPGLGQCGFFTGPTPFDLPLPCPAAQPLSSARDTWAARARIRRDRARTSSAILIVM